MARLMVPLMTLALVLAACGATSTTSPRPSASPPTAQDETLSEALLVVRKFVISWRTHNWGRLVELVAPADRDHYTPDGIEQLLRDFSQMAHVSRLAGSAGPALPTSLPPDGTVEGPVRAIAVPIRLSFETDRFGVVAFHRTLLLTQAAEGWRVRWRPSILFPVLGDDGHLAIERSLSMRGRILAEDGTVFAETRADAQRVYPQEWLAGQTIGYVSPVTADDLATLGDADYRAGDVIGRSGLESGAEALLRGSPGFVLSAVAASGESKPVLERPTVPGADLSITIRPDLQRVAEAAIGHYHEAATVVLDPSSGDVWALASAPLFNPNAMTLGTTLDGRRLDPPDVVALRNHAVQSAYPAGSSFKPFTLLAALKLGLVSPATRMPCQGTWTYAGYTFHNFEDHHLSGQVSLVQAMAFSCNTTYMPLSIRVWEANRTALSDLVSEFGFGQVTGIEHLVESPGILPDAAYFERTPRWDGAFRPYGPFDQIQMAIGQGDYLGTPLQLANAYAAFANRGTLWVPRLVTRATLPDGKVVEQIATRAIRHIELTADQWDYLFQALHAVTSQSIGTAYYAFVGFGVPVAGKSGTAETGTPQPDALFPAFAPLVDPQITVASILVRVPLATGGSDSAPLVRQLMAYYFSH